MQTEDSGEPASSAPPNRSSHSGDQQLGTDSGWKFKPENTSAGVNSPPLQPAESVSWTASEYIAHHKSLFWFAGLGLTVAILALGIYLLTQEVLSTVVVVVIGLSFGIFGARQPQVLQYILDEKGLHISGKLYPYERIKSFATIQEGPLRSILLMPLQRFMPPLSVYYDQADEAKILDVIGSYIPHEDHAPDMVDRLMSRIRF